MKTKLVRVSDSGMTTSEDLSKLPTLLYGLNTLMLLLAFQSHLDTTRSTHMQTIHG